VPKLTREESERGAIAAVFGIALACGLLIGVLGLVIDGGTLMVEQQRVRAAADRVADAVGMHCARDSAGSQCLTDNYSTTGFNTATLGNSAVLNALANPSGGEEVSVLSVCGKTVAAMGLPVCPALTSRSYDCKTNHAAVSGYPNWARVYTGSTNPVTPVFMSLISGDVVAATPAACAQVYWGPLGRVQFLAGGAQLPIMVSTCDADAAKFGTVVSIKDSKVDAGTSCSLKDFVGAQYSSTSHGFFALDPTSASASCSNLTPSPGTPGCARFFATDVPFNQTAISGATPVNDYTTLVSALRLGLGKSFVVPVVDKNGGSVSARSFALFKLLGFRMPTKGTGARAVTALNAYGSAGNYGTQLTTLCGATSTSTSVPCVIGVFSPSVISGYGQPAGSAPSVQSVVPNLGYQMVLQVN
jgi:Flp pilus assembly protein TadG